VREADSTGEVVLIVDDDPSSVDLLRHVLRGRSYRLVATQSGEEALDLARREQPSLVLLDVVMPGIDGYEVCARLKADPATSDCAVVFLSALDAADNKVRGFELGAVDYLAKPFDREEVLARVDTHLTVQRLQRQLQEREHELERELRVAQALVADEGERHASQLLGESSAAQELRSQIQGAACSQAPILLVGHSGAGEEAVARAIHHSSERGGRPFARVDCLTVRDSAALFGAESRWDLARGGTLYFDPFDRLPSHLVGELLERVQSPEPGDPRVISHTADYQRERPEGWRVIRIPELSERTEDISVLADHFLARGSRRQGRKIEGLAPTSLLRLKACPWPGQIDELHSVLSCALTTSSGPWVEVNEALLEHGRRLGSYELVRCIGRGAMGEVWEAKHRLLIRPAAVKLIRSARLSNPATYASALRQFETEARATAALESPNTVRLFDFGVTDDGALYYVMEYLRGLDLDSLVTTIGPLPLARALSFMDQACASLAEAHERGLIHRDVKPANLFACTLGPRYDVLKVLDFGLVQEIEVEASGCSECGAPQSVMGTPAFLAPEVITGAPSPSSDIYSLGCTIFWLLTGQRLFAGGVQQQLRAHVSLRPPLVSQVSEAPLPPELDTLIAACLEKEPQNRPASAAEIRARLAEIPFSADWTNADAKDWWQEQRATGQTAATSSDETIRF
jgi:DNA-binding NtrC family response regulator